MLCRKDLVHSSRAGATTTEVSTQQQDTNANSLNECEAMGNGVNRCSHERHKMCSG
jgi:hypothetical protein